VNRRWPIRYQSTDFKVFGLSRPSDLLPSLLLLLLLLLLMTMMMMMMMMMMLMLLHTVSDVCLLVVKCFRILLYILALGYAQIPSIHSCLQETNKQFFRSMSHPFLCIFSLFPLPRDCAVTSTWRSACHPPTPVRSLELNVLHLLCNTVF